MLPWSTFAASLLRSITESTPKPISRYKIRLCRIQHLVSPRRMLSPNDRPHLIEQVQIRLLNFRCSFYKNKPSSETLSRIVKLTFCQLNLLWLNYQVWKVRFLVMAIYLRLCGVHSCVVILQVCLTPFAREHPMRCNFFALRCH